MKGSFEEIKQGDVLILKYQGQFIGYGRATSNPVTKELGEGWNHIVPVNLWITGQQSGIYGVKDAQEGGSNYDTVKKVERRFALEKMEDIGFPF